MDKKRLVLLGILLVLLIALVIIFFRSGGEERIEKPPATPPPEPGSVPTELPETKKVLLFFLSENDTLLHPEEREIFAGSSIVHQAKQTIEELINGSQSGYVSPFPPETKVRELFVTEQGIAYVDFSREILEKHPAGSSAEISTIFSIVNSLTYNFKSINRVFILIEGGEKETLGGHINLSRAFRPQYDIIAK
ncbi:MAG: GerMN domain-containing protein [Candidatus Aminicenantes bacterium]|nr:MAG: GerMN domain-containing protein [Candidatus Aminicenantes bacterium]